MQKLYSHFRSLSLLLLCSATIAQCMETQEDKPITWAQMYYGLSELLIKDIMPLILSFHLDASGIDYANLPALIKESCKTPQAFVKSIDLLLKPENHTLVAEIFERAFAHEKISICDIKDDGNDWNVLHEAICNKHPEVVKFILNVAGDKTWMLLPVKNKGGWTALHCAACYNNPDTVEFLLNTVGNNAWTLLTIQDNDGWTALHFAANNNSTEIVELLLNTAGDNAQKFMDVQNDHKKTAFDIAGLQAKKIIKKYRKNNQ